MPKEVRKKTKCARQVKSWASHDSLTRMPRKYCVEHLETPTKSYADQTDYRVIRLQNGLTALLASRPADSCDRDLFQCDDNVKLEEAEESRDSEDDRGYEPGLLERLQAQEAKSATKFVCSMSISVGHFSDPPHVPGVARILTSILPRYSIKYPMKDDNFKEIVDWDITECNAETSIFAFETDNCGLNNALHRFTQCYIAPLLRPDDVASEIENLLTEVPPHFDYEGDQLLDAKACAFANTVPTGNPIKSFGKDYLKALADISADVVYEEVLKFHKRHYSANRMKLFVKAQLSLDNLEEIVKKYFAAIPSNGLPPLDFSQYNYANTFDMTQFCRIYRMKQVQQKDVIELTWSLPPSQRFYRTKSLEYIMRILAYMGEGSLMEYFKKKNWCTDISCEVNESNYNDNSMYTLIELTIINVEHGFERLKFILDAVYSYISFIQREGPQKHIYDDMRDIEEATFRYHYDNEDSVTELCRDMHRFRPVDYLSGWSRCYEYDPVSIKNCLDLLKPELGNILIYDTNFHRNIHPTLKVEPLFKESPSKCSNHQSYEIPESWMKSWQNAKPFPEFKLPEANIFRCNDFTLIPLPDNPPLYPIKVYSDESSEIWYKPDAIFRLPLSYMNFLYCTPLPLMSSENAVMLDLFVTILNSLSADDLRGAPAASLFRRICAREIGLEVCVEGFSQKVPLVMEKIAKAIANCCKRLTKPLFDYLKSYQVSQYEYTLTRPGDVIHDIKNSTTRLVHWSTIDKLSALSALEYSNFLQFHKLFVSHIYVKCLVQGNITLADVLENVRKYSKILEFGPLLKKSIPLPRYKKIPRRGVCVRIKSVVPDNNKAVKNYYQFYNSTQLSVVIDLINSILTFEVFNELRELENMTQVACSFTKERMNVLGYSMSRRSNDCRKIAYDNASIENIRKSIEMLSKNLTNKEWLGVKKIAGRIMYKPYEKLRPELLSNWNEIISAEYMFDRRARELHVLRKLTAEQIRKFVSVLTLVGPPMRKLSFQYVSQKKQAHL